MSQPAVKPGQPVCLVLAPTRELAQQTARVFDEAGAKCGVRCVCVYGGSPKYEQKKLMREAPVQDIDDTSYEMTEDLHDFITRRKKEQAKVK